MAQTKESTKKAVVADQQEQSEQATVLETEVKPEVKPWIVTNTSYHKVATTDVLGNEVIFAARESKATIVAINMRNELYIEP